MAGEKYTFFLWTLICLSCVYCDLNLNEGEACVTSGYNGTCVNIYKCRSASFTAVFRNSGFDPHHQHAIPDMPDICSYENNEPVVCCTDCGHEENRGKKSPPSELRFPHNRIDPMGHFARRGHTVASDKCFDYLSRMPYKCRGGNIVIKVMKNWNEGKKCHQASLAGSAGVGGRSARRFEFPHLALLGYGDDVNSAQWLCGGSIISEKFILTAGHCISTPRLGYITFAALGMLKRTDPKEYWKIYKIKRIIAHPEYRPPSKYHDIALLETETEINFGKDILPACLDTGDKDTWSYEASGWGKLGHNKALADTLQVVSLEEFSEEECAAFYQPHRLLRNGYNHATQICCGRHDEVVDTCEGDSGGPLHYDKYNIDCHFYIVGVTSYGKDCGILGSAGMYTRVSHYVPWIESIVWPEETEAAKKKFNLLLDNLFNTSDSS